MSVELEYEIVREGTGPEDYIWEGVVIGISGVEPLAGFRVRTRAVEDIGPQGPQYPAWELLNQTITISKPNAGPQTFGAPGAQYGGGEWAEGGIEDDSGYIYTEVFDQTFFYYLPPFSGANEDEFTGEVEAINGFPDEPYDPANGVYPMDTITRYLPDQRSSVIITYTVETEYVIGHSGPQGSQDILTDTITIYHEVSQPVFNWGLQLLALQQKTYFFNGIYH
ncbi:hypothetical protein SCRM01_057c [Synechococcus phage S-CRM01]|uniref:hypothetical protein n=1 Tax=Synechococcus phage S-CRM01 TaxID=1026955 RepID=UPI000209E363|nr:hypothetical protein SCRM01_057c [Synechococcus phage S-CRM01]AEC53004.1 hypothetical protein SCRM01_057c [Synechococcus phage S-CRM01]